MIFVNFTNSTAERLLRQLLRFYYAASVGTLYYAITHDYAKYDAEMS